ncbi:leucine-rich repeat extensin-like protein 2 [Diaphorina citri]|uniref:Leucine-rich repeat extensin-like protein 2 n=1 Tax=Diaphorina citri TaxID=121845 RepID=A0A1S3D9A2_DIACI|nr:leucine-rich repeat extensin-like protein 2 [Diaphorina citri]
MGRVDIKKKVIINTVDRRNIESTPPPHYSNTDQIHPSVPAYHPSQFPYHPEPPYNPEIFHQPISQQPEVPYHPGPPYNPGTFQQPISQQPEVPYHPGPPYNPGTFHQPISQQPEVPYHPGPPYNPGTFQQAISQQPTPNTIVVHNQFMTCPRCGSRMVEQTTYEYNCSAHLCCLLMFCSGICTLCSCLPYCNCMETCKTAHRKYVCPNCYLDTHL